MTAILAGELSRSFDPAVSEWGNPLAFGGNSAVKIPTCRGIAAVEETRGTETSKYPEENKSNEISSVAVSESETA